MKENYDNEELKILRPRSKATEVFSLMSLFAGKYMSKVKSLTAGVSKYTRHQGAKECARRMKNGGQS